MLLDLVPSFNHRVYASVLLRPVAAHVQESGSNSSASDKSNALHTEFTTSITVSKSHLCTYRLSPCWVHVFTDEITRYRCMERSCICEGRTKHTSTNTCQAHRFSVNETSNWISTMSRLHARLYSRVYILVYSSDESSAGSDCNDWMLTGRRFARIDDDSRRPAQRNSTLHSMH